MAIIGGLLFGSNAHAQKEKEKKDSKKEIIIIKDGEKENKFTIETKDGEVFINGKPAKDYKGDDLSFRDGKNFKFDFDFKDLHDMMGKFDSMGGPSRGFLGVVTEKENNQAKVKEVTGGSSADRAGIKAGDIITKVNDKVVHSPEELANAITAFKPNDEVTITYIRDGKTKEVKAALGEQKMKRSFSFRGPGMEGLEKLKELEILKDFKGPGMDHVFMFNDNRPRMGIKIQDMEENAGVKVVDVEAGSAAEKAGIQKDDILVQIGDKRIANTDDARSGLTDAGKKDSYPVIVKRNGKEIKLEVKLMKKLKTVNL